MRETNETAAAESDDKNPQKDGGAQASTDPKSPPSAAASSPGDTLPPRRRRRAASRPAGPAGPAEGTVTSVTEPAAAPPPQPEQPSQPGDGPAAGGAEEQAAPARPRRRASRRAGAPAGPPQPAEDVTGEAEAAAEKDEQPAADTAPPARSRRRASRKVSAPVTTAEESAARPEPRETAADETGVSAKPESSGKPESADEGAAGGGVRRRATRKPVSAADSGSSRAAAAAETGSRKKRGVPPMAVFQAPVFTEPSFQTPQSAAAAAAAEDSEEEEQVEDTSRRRRRRRAEGAGGETPKQGGTKKQTGSRDEAGTAEAATAGEDTSAAEPAETEGPGEEQGERPARRRRRGGRRRRRGENAESAQDAEQGEEPGRNGDAQPVQTEPAEEAAPESSGQAQSAREKDAQDKDAQDGGREAAGEGDEEEDETTGGGSGSSSSRRRRRRRRRSGDSAEQPAAAAETDDPERTVVKVREPRKKKEEPVDEVQAIKGSTRLEAKKQRRREGREQGRRRVPIITEAEFLARREAVKREMVVRQSGERTQIGILEDDVLVEHFVNKEQSTSYVGNVYLGKVQNVLPSMEAAFVDIGKGRNAVLYAGEVNFEALGMAHGPRRIETALKSGQSVLVQVTKDPIGHKGARLTSQVSLPGRYLVYVPEGSMTGISRKLPDTERSRLKQILKKVVPEDAGVIVRTAAEGASEDELRRDVERLQAQWEEIQRKSTQKSSSPTLLYGEPDMTVRVVRDIFNEDFTKVIVSGDEAWRTIHGYVEHVAPDLTDRLQKWTSDVDVFATYRIDEQLMKALDRKVWLPSGGSLVIDRTEAMIVVDVNTGKFTGQGGNLEETVTRNNLEAAEEIVRQLRLRDLGGIIVIDFIDMVLESNRDLVLRRLLECLGRDRTKHQVAEVTSLGLVQMTRKRVGQGLLESFSEACVHCNGRGVIVHMEQVAAVGGGGNGKKSKKKKGAGVPAQPSHEEALLHDHHEPAEQEPKALPEPDFVPDEELYSSAAEATEAASRGGRSRRRASRKATAPEGSPQQAVEPGKDGGPSGNGSGGGGTDFADGTPSVTATEPEQPVAAEEKPARSRRRGGRKASAPAGSPSAEGGEGATVVTAKAETEQPSVPEEKAAEPVAAPEPAAEAPARPRRRASRKVSAPAGPPVVAEETESIVVPAAETTAAAESIQEDRTETESAAEAAPAPTRRRATRKVSAPAGSPSSSDEDGAVTVVAAEDGVEAAEAKPAAKKGTARKAPAKKAAKKTAEAAAEKAEKPEKKTAAKKAPAKKTAVKKAPAKKAAAKKTAAKKTAAAEEPSAPVQESAED